MKTLLLCLLALTSAVAQPNQPNQRCVFCQIIRGELEASVVLRTDKVIAFLDHQPINPGHTLVIPLAHHENLTDTPPDLAAEMMKVAQKIGNTFTKAGVKSEAYQLHMNNGQLVQRVRHAHLHVYPRFRGDFPGDSVVRLAEDRKMAPRPELNEIADKLKRALDSDK